MSTASTVQPLPPQPPPPPPPAYTYPPITIILTIILLIFFFVGFFSIYFCRCFMQNILYTWHLRHSPTGTPVGGAGSSAAPGLDPLIVQSFPTFTYSTVKDYRKEKYGLECAICLVEFGADDILRLLTTCCHVFHQECIDLWLESHKTCPVCRRNLDAPLESPVKSPNNNNVHESSNITNENHETGSQDDNNFVSITIKEGNEEDESTSKVCEKGPSISCSSNSGRKCYNDRNYNCGQRRENKVEKFPRSHSTGHSIFRDREEEDRFTLRLPQHVKLSLIIKGHHNSSKSWTAFGEYKDKDRTRNVSRLAEVSGGDNSKV